MKNYYFGICLLVLCSIFSSCNKEDTTTNDDGTDINEPLQNYIEYKGKQYEINKAFAIQDNMWYGSMFYRLRFTPSAVKYDTWTETFLGISYGIKMDICFPEHTTKLPTGTFYSGTSDLIETDSVYNSYFVDENYNWSYYGSENDVYIKSMRMIISKTGSNYCFKMNGLDNDGNVIKLCYEGSLFDHCPSFDKNK